MTADVNNPTASSAYRYMAIIGVVCLSLIIPALIVWVSVASALHGKPLGTNSTDHQVYQGAVKDGVLWMSAGRVVNDGTGPTKYESRIKRFDLAAGEETETGLAVVGNSLYTFRIGEEVYAASSSDLYRINGTELESVAPLPKCSANFHPLPFLYENQITTIAETDDGGFRLVHLVNDGWNDGRKIPLPGLCRTWDVDLQRDRTCLRPLTLLQLPTAVATRLIVRVVQQEQDVHIMQSDFQEFSAYRNGFEFADQTADEASALAPENAPREVSGWEPVDPANNNTSWFWMECDRQGLVFSRMRLDPCVIRRNQNGNAIPVGGLETATLYGPVILAHPLEKETFLVQEDLLWGTASVHRLVDNSVQPAHLTTKGSIPGYLARWKRLILGLFLAWLVHHAVLAFGTSWLTIGSQSRVHHFGIQRALLASVRRRSLAFVIDLVFGLIVISVIAGFTRPTSVFHSPPTADKDLCNFLFERERTLQSLVNGVVGGNSLSALGSMFSSQSMVGDRQRHREYVLLGMSLVLVLWFIKVAAERAVGFTPGKWLTGIRTVRSTLRPAALSQLLARDLLLCIDIPLLITSIPAAVSLLFSSNSQRIGDRVAGTVVIRAGSIHQDKHDGIGDASC